MSELEEIKEKIDIVPFIQELVPLKKKGRNFVSNCPFHREKTASFVVSPERQIWHCFGACNEGGDIFKFLMKWENIEFGEALKELAKRAGVKLQRVQIEDQGFKKKEKIYEINHLTSEYYHYLLTKHALGEKGRIYLKERGISDKIIKTFQLGYAPNGWRNLGAFLIKKGYKIDDLEKAGVIIRTGANRFYDRFRGRLIFTLFDHNNNIVGFSGRVLEKETKEAKYINSPETEVYHKGKTLYGLNVTKEEVRQKKQLIICEGEFDVLTSFQAGLGNIAAVKGTALTNDQLRLIKRYADEVILAFDMDVAGNLAAKRAIEMAEDFSLNLKVMKLTTGKDLDESVKLDFPAVKEALKKTVSIYDFLIDSAVEKYPLNDPFSKKKIGEEIVPFLSKIQNMIIKNHYTKKLANILGVAEEAIGAEIEKLKKGKEMAFLEKKADFLQSRKNRQEVLEEYLLALIVQAKNFKENLQFALKNIKIEDIGKLSIQKIFSLLEKYKEDSLSEIDKVLPRELLDVYNQAYLYDLAFFSEDKIKFEEELKRVVSELKKTILKRKISFLTTKIKAVADEQIVANIQSEIKTMLAEIQKLQ